MPRTSLLSHVVYLTPVQKRVFLAASKYSLTNLNAYIRDLLTRDVEMRAEQGEPYFAGLLGELRQASQPIGQPISGPVISESVVSPANTSSTCEEIKS